MQTTNAQTGVERHALVKAGGLTASRIQDDLSWGQGAIQPRADYTTADDQQALITAVLQSIEAVSDPELTYSACTDGRLPVKLMNGEIIPIREQLVGADMVSAFFVAEMLGPRFYKDPNAPVAERVRDVAEFLHENGLLPSSHVACGAAAGFEAIAKNILGFVQDERFIARLQALVPTDVYDVQIIDHMTGSIRERLDHDAYAGLDGQVFLDVVQKISGQRAIAELRDDNRGVHGHVEEAIIRVRIPGYAINEAKVAELTGDREVFGVNDNRIERLARLFARGDDTDYRTAYLALEAFADAGHGTLAKDLPTWIVTRE